MFKFVQIAVLAAHGSMHFPQLSVILAGISMQNKSFEPPSFSSHFTTRESCKNIHINKINDHKLMFNYILALLFEHGIILWEH